MSLIPIIYTSLLIFGVAFLAVLIISYISYRIKQNNQVAYASPQYKVNAEQRAPYLQRPVYKTTPQQYDIKNAESRNDLHPYSETKNLYYRNERHIGDKKIDVIYKEKPISTKLSHQPVRRMTVIDDLDNAPVRNKFYAEPRQIEFSSFSEGNILRYYEDF